MTNIGHFRAAGKVLDGKTDIPTRLWIAPPTKMDAMILNEEGYYGVLGSPAPAWKCRAARCAWATRRRSARAAPRCRPRRATGFGRAGRGVRADGQDPVGRGKFTWRRWKWWNKKAADIYRYA